MTTAVVILNYNGKRHLEQFLPTVVTHSPGLAIYVADNCSTDDSVELLEKQFPAVNLILLDKNHGFAGGYNRALAMVKADNYILLNSDVMVSENWYEEPLKLLNSNPKVAAVQPKIRSYTNPDTFEHAGAAGGFLDRFGFPFCRGRIITRVEKDEGQYDEETCIFWASGACMFIRSSLFHEAGGFDSRFFAHMEEIDLCWRLKNMGYEIRYTPKSSVYHLGGGTLSYASPRKTFLNFRNNLFMLIKNLPEDQLKTVLRKRMAFDTLAGIKFFLGGEFRQLGALWKAHREYFRLRNTFLAERKQALFNRTFDFPEVYKKSIVVDFYLRRKRTFGLLTGGGHFQKGLDCEVI